MLPNEDDCIELGAEEMGWWLELGGMGWLEEEDIGGITGGLLLL